MSGLNFQYPVLNLRKNLQIVLTVILAFSVGVLTLCLVQVYLLSSEREGLVTDISTQKEALGVDVVAITDLHSMSEQALHLNTLISHKGEPVQTVLEAVEEALLVNVRLDRFEYNAAVGAATLEAISPDTINLADFVSNLESVPLIDQVVVVRQEKDDTPQALNRYEILLTAEAPS